MDHIQSRHSAAVAGHLSCRIKDNMVCHGHCAQSGARHIGKIARADISDSHGSDRQIDAADADLRPFCQAEALRPLCRDLSDDRARQKDIRELFPADSEIFQHLLPVSPRADIKIDRRSQDRILSGRPSGQKKGEPALQLDDTGCLFKHFRLMPSDPQKLCARPDRVRAHLPGVLADFFQSEMLRDLRRLFCRPGIAPEDCSAKRTILLIEKEHGLSLSRESDHPYI